MTIALRKKLSDWGAAGILPWLVVIAALSLYFVTLNRSVCLSNLPQVAQLNGWDWQPSLLWPLEFVVTYPLRFLPPTVLPEALNTLTAVLAALTLGLLARSVALLPHDRTPLQRELLKNTFGLIGGRAALVPPILAVATCGLQLSFWLHATGGTGEILKLLVFAYVIRCLLEFRLDGRQIWLSKAAFVYGLGMANDWAMIGFLPLFIFVLILVKGLAFFNPRFLVRMALFGLGGLALLLLLPAIQMFTHDAPVGFWQALRFEVVTAKNALAIVFNRCYSYRPAVAVLLGLTSVIPVILMCIRWRIFSADTSPLGTWVANTTFNFAHILFFVVCVWVTFDPPFSPTNASRLLSLPFAAPLLKLYYLSCLAVGYYSGYLLVVFSRPIVHDLGYRPGAEFRFFLGQLTCSIVKSAVWALTFLVPLALFYKNYPIVRTENMGAAAQYGAFTAECLPQSGAIVLSDDPYRQFLTQAAMANRGRETNFVLLNTQMLPYGIYHKFLRNRYPKTFGNDTVTSPTNDYVNPVRLVLMMSALAQSNQLWYAHPSFGYYFEQFYPEPHGLAYKLNFYPTNQISPPVPAENEIANNERFWAHVQKKALEPLTNALALGDEEEKFFLMRKFMELAKVRREPGREVQTIAAYYSRALNNWGVELQRAGRLQEAAKHFAQALALNPDNIAAEINLQFNKTLQAGRPAPVVASKSTDEQIRAFRTLERAMNVNGPFDEPNFCFNLGKEFVRGLNYRQAAQQFERAVQLAPDNIEARLWLGRLFNLLRLPDKALELIAQTRTSPALSADESTNALQFMLIEATAQSIKSNVPAAFEILESAIARHPTDTNLLGVAMYLYLAHGDYSNALAAAERFLRIAPDDVGGLISKGVIYMQLNAHAAAIAPLSRALALQPTNYVAMFNRAVAYLQSGELDAAQSDYLELSRVFPTSYQVYYGLGEIAFRKKDTNAAIIYYQNYLSNAIPGSAEAEFVKNRLDQLTGRTR